ncbi:hypothetical protein EYF80_055929 [Liparis tanakae]|uniref:Uncharacterized protein n=1 Tax=Liparis tanakae TaxID=230148 RepID=A0A4Z2EZ90_9TELE|nr:hypothetical protein EYF80_055929 [Liparis tanakae]
MPTVRLPSRTICGPSWSAGDALRRIYEAAGPPPSIPEASAQSQLIAPGTRNENDFSSLIVVSVKRRVGRDSDGDECQPLSRAAICAVRES